MRGEIAGPPDTPYEGATYVLDIKIPETYPFNPPKVWHLMVISCDLFVYISVVIGSLLTDIQTLQTCNMLMVAYHIGYETV